MDTQGASRFGGDAATAVATKCLARSGVLLKGVITMARYELVGDEDNMTLLRDGERIIGLGGPREWAEQQLDEYRDQEAEARKALATGDPFAVCHLGWHRGPLPAPITGAFDASLPYFNFRAKIGMTGGTLIYSVADEPFNFQGRTVKCLGMLTPWSCAVCEQPIDSNPDR